MDFSQVDIKKDVAVVVDTLLRTVSKRATKYVSDKFVIAAQRRSWEYGVSKRDTRAEIVLKIGAPNYAESIFIKRHKKAGGTFPVREVVLKAFPVKKKKKSR